MACGSLAAALLACWLMTESPGREYAVGERAESGTVSVSLAGVAEGDRVAEWRLHIRNHGDRVARFDPARLRAEDEIGNVYERKYTIADMLPHGVIVLQPGESEVYTWRTSPIVANGKTIWLRVRMPDGTPVRFIVRPEDVK